MPLNCEKMKKMIELCKKNIYPAYQNKDPIHFSKMYMCILLAEEINKKCN